MITRKPAVAGKFYPAGALGLRRRLNRLMTGGEGRERALAVVVPHAGYMYSGGVAGAVFARIEPARTFVLLGPNHHGLGATVSIMTAGVWQMPMGAVAIDADLATAILSASPRMREDHRAHELEHALEVMVPFIQALAADARIVPISIASTDYDTCQEIGQAVARGIRACGESVVVVASTDMTHYEPHSQAEAQDRKAIDQILKLDPEALFRTVRQEQISMCGIAPTTATLIACRQLGAARASLVKYATSAEASGNYNAVVGYAGVVIT